MRGSRGGTGGPDPSGKSQVICVFMEISIWTPPPPPLGEPQLNPPEKCWTPLQNCKISWGLKIKNNVVAVVFRQSGLPPPLPLWQRFLDPRIAKKIAIASPVHLNYEQENVLITTKVIFKDFPTAIFPSYGTTVSFSIPQTYHPLI